MGTNTGIGIGIGIPFKNNALGGDNIYFPPELKARMIGVWDNYGKKNTDVDRNIIKNKIPNAGGDLEILNSAYKLNSGFGEYREDFTSWIVSKEPMTVEKTDSQVHISYIGTSYKELPMFEYSGPINENYSLTVEIQGIPNNVIGKFIHNNGFTQEVTNGINTIKFSNSGSWYGFTFYHEDNTIIGDCDITIKQIPKFEGALVTDGINDIVASIKTLEEWNIGDKGITIVSMIHQINANKNFTTTNNLRNKNRVIGRNTVTNIGKTGIYGWYKKDIQGTTATLIDNILGDKNDYTGHYTESTNSVANSKFYVTGYAVENGFTELSSVAHYWTFAVLGKATEDEINLIIAKYNLDRTLRPDILCDIEKQGITNENHAEFGDKLIDFSGNGRDIQLNNIAWKGDSGIGKYEVDFLDSSIWNSSNSTITSSKIDCKNAISHIMLLYYSVGSKEYPDIPSFKVIKTGADIDYSYIDETGSPKSVRIVDGVNVLPASHNTLYSGSGRFCGFGNPGMGNSVTITQIPSHAGGLCLDGVNDFGKVTGMPIYKDYTVVTDREIFANTGAISSKNNPGAFVETAGNSVYSFGQATSGLNFISTRSISYLSKYSYCGQSITAGAAEDGTDMWLGTIRDNDHRFFNGAIYSLMSFPYSMSEFLIERQLKKHKLGTLYPDMVEFRPVIKANANYKITYYQIDSTNTWKSIKVGDYIVIGAKLAFQITFDNDASELKEVVSPQLSGIIVEKRPSNPGYNIYSYITSKSPQKINITIDEYIRYEDIVQPYPVLLRFNDENGNEVSWGGKFRVGSTITRIGYAADSNLLPNIYNIFGLLLNDNQVTSSKVIVEKTMVFKAKSAYIFDNNEPNCILSPRLLRIPNSSYKILGYIPDISGHGNHGVIHNSAYAGASGANGYPYDYNNSSFWCDSNLAKVVSGELVEYFAVKNSTGFSNITSGVYKGEIKVTGVTKAISENKISRLRIFTNSTTDKEIIDITQDGNYNIDIKGVGDANRVFFYAIPNNSNESIIVRLTEPIRIEQVGEHEGAYCFDGVNDHVTIPTVSGGGKQVLMKVNNNTINSILYDQRSSGASPNSLNSDFAIYNTNTVDNNLIAYQSRLVGKTYIDGILNTNITCEDLLGVLHNITITCDIVVPNNGVVPNIGRGGVLKDLYSKVALYDFMLFDSISTDDKIKELNEYVGIEAKVELPPYYWDAYGKTNLDEDKATIQQRGVAEGDYDITNYNHAYDKMSGYGGYNLGRFDKSWASSSSSNTSIKVVQRNPYDITLKKLGGNSDWEFNNKELKVISNPVSVKFKSNKNIRVTCDYHYHPVGENSEGIPLRITFKDLIANKDAIITISPISQENIDKYNIDVNRGYYLICFQLSFTLAVNEEVTIEMLPLYPNGLVYDGVDDYSENVSIPIFDDFTFLVKASLPNGFTGSGGAIAKKGSNTQVIGGGYDFVYALDSNTNEANKNSYWSFGKALLVSTGAIDPPLIGYMTKTNVNGIPTTAGTNPSIEGITFSRWSGYISMIFYKAILYPKTIPLLQINFLKNLMERDEIIDLDNPIFKK